MSTPKGLFEVTFRNKATQPIKGISDKHWAQIDARLESLKADPRPHDSIKLKAKNPVYRLDVGEYRIAYQIHEDIRTIRVVLIGHRKDFYDKLKAILF